MSGETSNNSQNTPNEVDLIDLFCRIGNSLQRMTVWTLEKAQALILLLIRKSLWIAAFAALGALVGYVRFSTTPRYYSSEMVAISNALDNSHIVASINALNDLFKNRNYTIAGNFLEIPPENAEQIKSISAFYGIDVNRDAITDYVDYANSFNPRDTSTRRIRDFFYVKMEVFDGGVFAQASSGIKRYINKNSYVLENNRVQIAQSEELLKSIEQEIQKLESLQKMQYFELPKSREVKSPQVVVINEKEVTLFHEPMLALQRQKQQIAKELSIKRDPITIVQDFTPLAKAENTLYKYLAPSILLFAILGFAISILWQHRKRLRSLIAEKR